MWFVPGYYLSTGSGLEGFVNCYTVPVVPKAKRVVGNATACETASGQ